jgi:uncharacterized integral membrane protein
MPRRLILFIFIFVTVLLFIIFNLKNKSDISFGFAAIKDIPVFLTVFVSFILGMLCTLPFVLGLGGRKKNREEKQGQGKPGLTGNPSLSNKPDRDSGKSGDDDYSDRGSYGID